MERCSVFFVVGIHRQIIIYAIHSNSRAHTPYEFETQDENVDDVDESEKTYYKHKII